MGTIVIAVLVVIILIVLVALFVGRVKWFGQTTQEIGGKRGNCAELNKDNNNECEAQDLIECDGEVVPGVFEDVPTGQVCCCKR